MSKRGIIGRVTQLSRADVNDLIDSAADPQSVLDQLARDFAANIADAEQAIAQLVCDLGANELDQEEDSGAVAAWSEAAEATSQAADLLRAEGVAADADRFDDLARIALGRQLTAEDDIKAVEHAIAAQTESIEILANGLHQMRIKLAELMHRQDKAVRRPGGQQAQSGPASDAIPRDSGADPRDSGAGPRKSGAGPRGLLDPASEVARFEQLVHREEARAYRAGEGNAPPEPRPAEPGRLGSDAEIEERLMALKTGRVMAAALARAQDPPIRSDQPFR
jgi:phage shock protein A